MRSGEGIEKVSDDLICLFKKKYGFGDSFNKCIKAVLHHFCSNPPTQKELRPLSEIKFPLDFAKWTQKNKWVWDVKENGKWIQFQGRGRGYKSERTADLYQIFIDSRTA